MPLTLRRHNLRAQPALEALHLTLTAGFARLGGGFTPINDAPAAACAGPPQNPAVQIAMHHTSFVRRCQSRNQVCSFRFCDACSTRPADL